MAPYGKREKIIEMAIARGYYMVKFATSQRNSIKYTKDVFDLLEYVQPVLKRS